LEFLQYGARALDVLPPPVCDWYWISTAPNWNEMISLGLPSLPLLQLAFVTDTS
jgi:hypothetical protein